LVIKVLTSLTGISLAASSIASVEVTTSEGRVRGDVEVSTRNHTEYAIFYGVPYAAPPVGPRRLLPPQPVEAWEGVWDNSESMSAVCLQRGAMAWEVPSEDCLYLTVATPALLDGAIQGNASLPVMFWIHGGGWVWGSGGPVAFNPDFFMDKGVVHVGINYRLGFLGFLALQGEAGGNQGLRDQNMALRWVQENIQAFGGDPGQVTMLGESSGSCSVFLHSVSPLASGLVHRAIAQSGGNLGPGFGNNPKSQPMAWEVGARVAEAAGCLGEPGSKLACLQGIEDGFTILEASEYGPYANLDADLGDEAFLPISPREALESGQIQPLDLILGFNKDEGLHVILDLLMDPENDTNFALVRDNWETHAPLMLFDQHPEQVTAEVLELCRLVSQFYLGAGGPANYDAPHIQGIVNMYSDAWYWYTMHQWTRLAVANQLTTYRYLFTHKTTFGLMSFAGVPFSNQYGVCHGDEVPLLYIPPLVAFDGDRKLLVEMWSDFAKTGKPTPDTGLWRPWAEAGEHLRIDVSPSMDMSEEVVARMDFWTDICGGGCMYGSGLGTML